MIDTKKNLYNKFILVLISILGFFLLSFNFGFAQTPPTATREERETLCTEVILNTEDCDTLTTSQLQACKDDGRTGALCLAGPAPALPPKNVNGGSNPFPDPSGPPAGTGMVCEQGLKYVNGLCVPESKFQNGIAGSTTLIDLIAKILKFALGVAGAIAVVLVVIGGFQYMTSGGNEEQAEAGKKTIINFVLGLVIIIMAYTLVTIVVNTLTK